ncbi:MAG: dockerin type I domain-containing protein [Candidatus Bathyarchaeia archaeon]
MVGVSVRLFDGSVSVSYSDYFYVKHGWVAYNWSGVPTPAQNAFLDPAQNNFTLTTNASGFTNPPLSQYTEYNSTEDSMASWFWIQFYPGNLTPGTYSLTGTWQEAAAANYPNYTDIYSQRTITLFVNPANSTTLVSLSPNLVSVGHVANCTATVSGLNATGTINWTTSSIGGSFGSNVGILSAGGTTTTYVDNFTGYVMITAWYSGDSNNAPSSGSAVLTVFVNVSTGTNVMVYPTAGLTLNFNSVTSAGYTVANTTPTVNAPPLNNTVGPYYNIKVTAGFSGNVTVSLAFDGSNMTTEQKNSLQMAQYTPIPGDFKGEGIVNILDAIILGNAFVSHCPNYDYVGEPASPNWNPNADLNGDGIINILDAIILGNHFLQTANWVNITLYVDTTNNIVYGQTSHFSFITIH